MVVVRKGMGVKVSSDVAVDIFDPGRQGLARL